MTELPTPRTGNDFRLLIGIGAGILLAIGLGLLVPDATGAVHLGVQALWPILATALGLYMASGARCAVWADSTMPAIVVRNRLVTWVIAWEDIDGIGTFPGGSQRRGSPTYETPALQLRGGRTVRCIALRFRTDPGSQTSEDMTTMCAAFDALRTEAVRSARRRQTVWPPPPGSRSCPPWARARRSVRRAARRPVRPARPGR